MPDPVPDPVPEPDPVPVPEPDPVPEPEPVPEPVCAVLSEVITLSSAVMSLDSVWFGADPVNSRRLETPQLMAFAAPPALTPRLPPAAVPTSPNRVVATGIEVRLAASVRLVNVLAVPPIVHRPVPCRVTPPPPSTEMTPLVCNSALPPTSKTPGVPRARFDAMIVGAVTTDPVGGRVAVVPLNWLP